MKNKLVAGILVCIATIAYSCVKEAKTLIETSTVGSYLTYNGPAPTGPGKFDYSNINTSSVSISVKGVGSPADQVNIYTGTSTDKASWKKIKTVAFSDSGILSVSGAELAAALGVPASDLTPGNTYTFYNEVVTNDGRMFSSSNTSSDFEGQSGYHMALQWQGTVFCSFDQSVFTGKFKVVKDDWADFAEGDMIDVKPGAAATQIVITAYPAPGVGTNRKDITLEVDPTTNEVTVAEQIYGDYPPVTGVTARGTGSVNSCAGTITLNLTHKYAGTDYAGNVLILQK